MKHQIERQLAQAVAELQRQGKLPAEAARRIQVQRARDARHGDFASNLALVLAKEAAAELRNPRQLAAELVAALPPSEAVEKTEIAGPGFINFFVPRAAYCALIDAIRAAGAAYGQSDAGAGRKVLVEFVSANPTGPLHVGHGRGAAYGDAVARLLSAAGYDARREYYLNDGGRQMDILALSVWLRYLEIGDEAGGKTIAAAFPANAYRGDYVRDLAADLRRARGDAFEPAAAANKLFADLPEDAEARLDALIARAKSALGEKYQSVFDHGCAAMVEDIRGDLLEFGVGFDRWFSERKLLEGGAVESAIAALAERGHIYEKAGATWFRATDFGDEKDRAVLRADNSHTYFAADIAYHFDKAERGFDLLLNVFGADHHGYAGRVAAAFEALGYDRERLQFRLVQFAALWRGKVKVPMSTRAGEFVSLRELREEVGADAARFFYVSRKNDQHMDFDLDLAKTQSADNPVYYIQYAHARICSVFRQAEEKGLAELPAAGGGEKPSTGDDSAADANAAAPNYDLLTEPGELELMQTLSRFPETVEHAAGGFEPHLVAYYLRDLARDFHAYYNAHPFLAGDAELRRARLGLIDAARQVIANGLALLGVSAPEKM